MITIPKLQALLGAIEDSREAGGFQSKYQLQTAAANTVNMGRAASCSRFSASADGVKLISNGYRSVLSGLVRCKYPQKCPFCQDIWLADNRRKVEAVIQAWDGAISSLTLTVGHRPSEAFGVVAGRLKAVKERFMASPEVRRWPGLTFLTSVETTVTESGWHPHIHGLIFSRFPLSDACIRELEAAWRRCLRDVTGRALRRSARIERVAREVAHRLGMYAFKRGKFSPFDLLAVISGGRGQASVIATAKDLWRDYCAGLVLVKGMRFVSVKGGDVKLGWAALNRHPARQKASEHRLVRFAQDVEYLSEGEDAALFENAVLRRLHPVSSASRRAIAEVEAELAEAFERREEAGYYDDLDPLQEVDGLMRRLLGLLGDMPPKERVPVAIVTLQGLKLLSAAGGLERLEAIQSIEELGAMFDKLLMSFRHSTPGSPLYLTNAPS